MRSILLWGVALLVAGVGTGCERTGRETKESLTIFAAASLTEAFREMGRAFEAANPRVSVRFSFAGSQQLRSQLEHGAPADVFASASQKEMKAALATGVIEPASVSVFARNRLVVIYPKDNPGGIQSLADLAREGVKIDVADPAVPIGRYTRQMIEALNANPSLGANFAERFEQNIISREHQVKAVVAKVRLGEVDAGVVYVTDVTPEAAGDLGTLEVPEHCNPTARYPIGVVVGSAEGELARRFVAFVAGEQGQRILAKHGFVE